jgi:hypothetical protein
MKARLFIFSLIAVCLSASLALALGQPKLGKTAKVDTIGITVTIPQLQKPTQFGTYWLDSLKQMDVLQTSGGQYDDSPYWHGSDTKSDTVRVTGIVMVSPKILSYTLQRYNTYLQDVNGNLWGGLNVLTEDSSANAKATNIPLVDTGMVVTITGRVTEYGTQPNSLTEMFAYKAGFFATVVGVEFLGYASPDHSRPAPLEVTCDSFVVKTTPMPSRGEKYEGMYVVIRNVTVTSVDQGYGSFTFQDAAGNWMKMYDGSGYFTTRGHRFTNSTYTPPPVGTVLKYIRGVITDQIRSGTCGDYAIMPLYPGPNELAGSTYPGDVVVDKYGPAITSVKRTPTPPKPTDIVNITYKSYNADPLVLPNTIKADSTFIRYRVGIQTSPGVGWIRTRVDSNAVYDTLYHTTIPAQIEGKLVSYCVEAWYHNVQSIFPDSTTPYFYVVRAAGPTLYDVVMSPYINASTSGFAYDTVTVSGVIIADTSDIKDITTRGGRANAPLLWLQAGTSSSTNKFNGIQIWSPLGPIVDTLRRGDSVSVRGSVYGTSNRISIAVTSMPYFRRGGSVMPTPYIRWMNGAAPSPYFDYALSNTAIIGNSGFQPYMSTLTQIDTAYVLYRNADNVTDVPSSTYTYGEYFLSLTSSPIAMTTYGARVNDNGMNHYYCDTNSAYISGTPNSYNTTHPNSAGMKGNKTYLIPLLAKISKIVGILDYTNGNYKLEPRKDDDFGTITPPTSVFRDADVVPKAFALEQNYPNPFNPTTTIRYTVPVKSIVTLKIYNILGQVVESLVNMDQGVGSYVVQFNASRLSTGVYFYELRAGNYRDIKKMLLLK